MASSFAKHKEEAPEIQGDENTVSAISAIILQQIHNARRYENGIVDDADPECLHQYRVNLRRARSILALSKGVFSEEYANWLKTYGTAAGDAA